MSPWQRSQRWVEPPPAAASGAAAGDLGLVTAKELLSAVVAANGSRQVVAATASALWRLVAASPPSAEDSDFEGLRGKVKLVEAELLVRGDISRLAGIEFTHASAARAWLCQRIEDEQGSDLAELLGQVRTGVSTLAKARNTAVHGPLRAGKQKGPSPSEASTSQDELSDSTAEKKYAVASFEVVAPTGGSIGTGKGSSHVIGIRRGAGSSAEATAGLGAMVLEDNELHVQQEQARFLAWQVQMDAGQQMAQTKLQLQAGTDESDNAEFAAVGAAKEKVSENKEYCMEVLENQDLQELWEQQRQAKVLAGQVQGEGGSTSGPICSVGDTTEKAAPPPKAHQAAKKGLAKHEPGVYTKLLQEQQKQAKGLAGQVQGEGGATSGSSCSETLGSCDAEGVDSASDGEDVTETADYITVADVSQFETSFSRAGLAKIELEIQQATTKGAKRIAKEAFRVYKIELEDAEFDEMVRISRAEELHRVYED